MMSNTIPENMRDLFTKRALAHLATLMPDGGPQVTPVWCDFDGRYVRVNTAIGRQKDKNLVRDGRVALSITDPDNPYRYLEVRGRIIERTQTGADAHIDSLSQKYLGQPYPYRSAGEKRVMYRINPEHVTFMG
jgi:PPOX class probable F420-dependent enzyme